MSSENEFAEKLEKIVNNIIKEEGYLAYEVHKKISLIDPASYLGQRHEIDIKGEAINGAKETNLYIKRRHLLDHIQWVSVTDVYRREMFAYRELSKIFEELQAEAKVPSHDRFNMVKSYEGSDTEVIVMENVGRRGYKPFERLEVASLELVEICVKQLARFHGLSFVQQKKQPDHFMENVKDLRHPYAFKNEWLLTMKKIIDLSMKYVDEDNKTRAECKIYKLAEKQSQFFDSTEMDIACICHGDYKPNNVMMKIDNGRLTDVLPVDFQILHYGNPVLDFLYFVFIGTDRKFRKAHLPHLKDLYHDTLRKFLEYFNIDVELLYPRKKFDEGYDQNLEYGLLAPIIFLPFIMMDDQRPRNLSQASKFNFPINNAFRDRLCDLIEEYIEWGYL